MKKVTLMTQEDQEVLGLLAEESSEVIQIIGKMLRHGRDSHHPISEHSNRLLLCNEISDLLYAIGLTIEQQCLDKHYIAVAIGKREKNLGEYFHQELPKQNWIKDLIHYKDTTLNLNATDKNVADIFDEAMKGKEQILDEQDYARVKDLVTEHLNNIMFKLKQ